MCLWHEILHLFYFFLYCLCFSADDDAGYHDMRGIYDLSVLPLKWPLIVQALQRRRAGALMIQGSSHLQLRTLYRLLKLLSTLQNIPYRLHLLYINLFKMKKKKVLIPTLSPWNRMVKQLRAFFGIGLFLDSCSVWSAGTPGSLSRWGCARQKSLTQFCQVPWLPFHHQCLPGHCLAWFNMGGREQELERAWLLLVVGHLYCA